MEAHSAAFDAAVGVTQRRIAKAELELGGKVIKMLTPMSDLTVNQDRTAVQRTSWDLTIVASDPSVVPVDMNSEIVPFGPEITVYSGLQLSQTEFVNAEYGSGQSHWAPQTEYGEMNGVVEDVDGSLVLGPLSALHNYPSPTNDPSPTNYPG